MPLVFWQFYGRCVFQWQNLIFSVPKKRFQLPSLGFTFFCATVAMAALMLAYWQHNRAQEKDRLQGLATKRMEAEPLVVGNFNEAQVEDYVWRKASATGTYDNDSTFLIDNRIMDKKAGFHVVTPLDLGGNWLLVNRGWVEAESPRTPAQVPAPPAGELTVEGILVKDSSDAFELGQDTGAGGIWQNLRIVRWEKMESRNALPLVLLANPATPGLGAVARAPDYKADRSRGYRLQWLLLAVVAAIGWVAYGFRRAG